MKTINFLNQNEDLEAKELLNWLWSIGGDYENDAKPRFDKLGYHVPEKQFKAYMKLIDYQYELDCFGTILTH